MDVGAGSAIGVAGEEVSKLIGVAHGVIAVTVVHQQVGLARLARKVNDRR
jgi:hypothetical protein